MFKNFRRRWDEFPTHKWIARAVFPIVIIQRWTQFISNEGFDTAMLAYLWWLSERTEYEAEQARKAAEE